MSSWSFLALWFLMPAILLSGGRIFIWEAANVFLSKKQNQPVDPMTLIPDSQLGWTFLVLGNALLAAILIFGTTFANVNEHWEYASPQEGFVPLPFWWLVCAAAAGGAMAGAILVVYRKHRFRKSPTKNE